MIFLVQLRHFRRGVSEVITTIPVAAADGAAALSRARSLAGTRFWPPRTAALRVMDEGGRTLIDWVVPVATVQPAASLPAVARERTHDEPKTAQPQIHEEPPGKGMGVLATHHHLFDVGQPVSYADGAKPDVWAGGYEIVGCFDPGGPEPRYAIRNADQSYDRIVQEHELREDLGARIRGR
jgi:hypothetical protein